jgi:hypothetical protein
MMEVISSLEAVIQLPMEPVQSRMNIKSREFLL